MSITQVMENYDGAVTKNLSYEERLRASPYPVLQATARAREGKYDAPPS